MMSHKEQENTGDLGRDPANRPLKMMSHKEQENTGGGREEESSRSGAENPEIFGDCKLATSSILLLFLLNFVATTLGRDPATANAAKTR
jgi:hypothetical protein